MGLRRSLEKNTTSWLETDFPVLMGPAILGIHEIWTKNTNKLIWSSFENAGFTASLGTLTNGENGDHNPKRMDGAIHSYWHAVRLQTKICPIPTVLLTCLFFFFKMGIVNLCQIVYISKPSILSSVWVIWSQSGNGDLISSAGADASKAVGIPSAVLGSASMIQARVLKMVSQPKGIKPAWRCNICKCSLIIPYVLDQYRVQSILPINIA